MGATGSAAEGFAQFAGGTGDIVLSSPSESPSISFSSLWISSSSLLGATHHVVLGFFGSSLTTKWEEERKNLFGCSWGQSQLAVWGLIFELGLGSEGSKVGELAAGEF